MEIQPIRMQNTVKAALRGKFIALTAYGRKEERSQIKNLSSCMEKLESKEQNKHKTSKKKEK